MALPPVLRPSILHAALPRLVHVPGLAADEGFVYFDLAAELVEALALHREANPVEHEPRGLSVSRRGRDGVPTKRCRSCSSAIIHMAGSHLSRPRGGIFKNCSRLERKLRLGVSGVALPHAVIDKISNFVAPQTGHLTLPSGQRSSVMNWWQCS